ncbi:MAG: 6-phosphogluconolactonase [Anaerolineales bacterium]|jgi:6-phosphogluconolactonase
MLKVYPDLEEVSRNTARILIEAAQSAVNKRGGFSLLLSGGNTPRRLFGLLAESPYREQVPWGKTHVFWGDERCVPADDERNNAYMARQILLERVPIPEEQIHPVASTLPPMKAAEKYQNTLREYFSGHPPIFDFILLGLGENGHTASLFPGTPVLDEKRFWVSEVYVPSLHMWRVTLTAPILNQARKIVFLVSGASKAWVLNQVLNGPHNPQQLPAQLIKPQDGQLLWLADKAAASQIQASSMKKSTD